PFIIRGFRRGRRAGVCAKLVRGTPFVTGRQVQSFPPRSWPNVVHRPRTCGNFVQARVRQGSREQLARGSGFEMSEMWKDRLYRISVFVGSLIIAAAIIWRGQNYNDAQSPEMVTPVMCVALALFIVLTGVALSLRGTGETEMD